VLRLSDGRPIPDPTVAHWKSARKSPVRARSATVVGERDAARERLDQKSVLRRAGSILNDYVKQDGFAGRCAMPNSRDLMKRARMFEERAEQAPDLISRQHYREIAAHYRSLAVEHQETRATLERELEHGNSD
jgi:hypothetical protein